MGMPTRLGAHFLWVWVLLKEFDRSHAPAWECLTGRSASALAVTRSVEGCIPMQSGNSTIAYVP